MLKVNVLRVVNILLPKPSSVQISNKDRLVLLLVTGEAEPLGGNALKKPLSLAVLKTVTIRKQVVGLKIPLLVVVPNGKMISRVVKRMAVTGKNKPLVPVRSPPVLSIKPRDRAAVVAVPKKLVRTNVKESITLTPNVSTAQELPPPHLAPRLLHLPAPLVIPQKGLLGMMAYPTTQNVPLMILITLAYETQIAQKVVIVTG